MLPLRSSHPSINCQVGTYVFAVFAALLLFIYLFIYSCIGICNGIREGARQCNNGQGYPGKATAAYKESHSNDKWCNTWQGVDGGWRNACVQGWGIRVWHNTSWLVLTFLPLLNQRLVQVWPGHYAVTSRTQCTLDCPWKTRRFMPTQCKDEAKSTIGIVAARKYEALTRTPAGKVSGPMWWHQWDLKMCRRVWSDSSSSSRGVSISIFILGATAIGIVASSN